MATHQVASTFLHALFMIPFLCLSCFAEIYHFNVLPLLSSCPLSRLFLFFYLYMAPTSTLLHLRNVLSDSFSRIQFWKRLKLLKWELQGFSGFMTHTLSLVKSWKSWMLPWKKSTKPRRTGNELKRRLERSQCAPWRSQFQTPGSTTTNDHWPTINDQKPTTNNRQPAINDQRLTTNDLQPTTNKKASKQANKDVAIDRKDCCFPLEIHVNVATAPFWKFVYWLKLFELDLLLHFVGQLKL